MSGASKSSNGMYGFDPRGLERAAKAAKFLDNSPNAKAAFELANLEEKTKQIEAQTNLKNIESNNKIKFFKMEAESQKEKALYEDTLARDRIRYRLDIEEKSKLKTLKESEESIKRQEQYKKETIKYENELRLNNEKEKLIQQYELQANIERKNFDIVEKKIRIKEQEKRQTSNEIAKSNLELIGKGIKNFLTDKYMFSKVLTGFSLAYISIYTIKGTINIIFKFLNNRLITPKLVKETSRLNLNNFYSRPFGYINNKYNDTYLNRLRFYNLLNNNKIVNHENKLTYNSYLNDNLFKDMFFEEKLKNSLLLLSNSLINKRKLNIPLRNFMFYGPPGNGKTLFAKNLAKRSGLDYAILSGSDILSLGSNASTALNKIFDWAETSNKGLLVFLDESDAFLKRRISNDVISENLRAAINTFLYRSGTPTKKFFVVLATNTPDIIDTAVQDRIDELVLFEKPNIDQRTKLINFYFNEYILNNNKIKRFSSIFNYFSKNKVDLIVNLKFDLSKHNTKTYNFVKDLSDKTADFSGREINKFIVYLHDTVFNKPIPEITDNDIELALNKFKHQKEVFNSWNIMYDKNKRNL